MLIADQNTFIYNGKEYSRQMHFSEHLFRNLFTQVYRAIVPGHIRSCITTNCIDFAKLLESKGVFENTEGDSIFVRVVVSGDIKYEMTFDESVVCPSYSEYWVANIKEMNAIESSQYQGQHFIARFDSKYYVLFLEKWDKTDC